MEKKKKSTFKVPFSINNRREVSGVSVGHTACRQAHCSASVMFMALEGNRSARSVHAFICNVHWQRAAVMLSAAGRTYTERRHADH